MVICDQRKKMTKGIFNLGLSLWEAQVTSIFDTLSESGHLCNLATERSVVKLLNVEVHLGQYQYNKLFQHPYNS